MMIDITVLYLILSIVLGFAGFFFGRVDGFKKGIEFSRSQAELQRMVSFDAGVCYEREFPNKRQVPLGLQENVKNGLGDDLLNNKVDMNIKKV